MSTVSSPFNPAANPGGSSFASLLGKGYGKVVFFNLSPFELRLKFDNGDERLAPAWWARRFDVLDNPCENIAWTIEVTPDSANPPLSQCWIEVYGEDEHIPEVYPAPLVRQANIGNSLAVNQSVTSVQNDGNAAPTQVIEATPSGAATSQLKWNNDGSGLFGGGNDVVNAAGVFTSMAADAIPVAAVGPGALDTDVTILAKQIVLDGTASDETFAGAGDLYIPHGLHVDGSLFGIAGVVTVGDAIKAAGGWDGSTTFPAAQLTGGVPSTQKVDSTNSGSTSVPQVASAVAGSGFGVKATAGTTLADGTAGATLNELYPTETNSQLGTVQVDFISAAGAIQAGPQIRTNSPAFGTPGQWMLPGGDNHTLGSTFSGTGAGTYSHFLRAKTPRYVGITSTETNSTETVGVDSIASSTVHVNMPNNWPFVAFAALS